MKICAIKRKNCFCLCWVLSLMLQLYCVAAKARDPFQVESREHLSTKAIEVVKEHWYPLRHQSVQRIFPLLTTALGVLGAEESLLSDELRNGVIMHLSTNHLRQAKRYLSEWDKASPQVDIMATIVDVESGFMDELGVTWRQATRVASPNKRGDFTMDLPRDQGLATVHIGVLDRRLLSLQLSALEQEGKGAIIARPHLLIEDNKEAVIEAGTEIPYSEKTKSGATSASFKKAVLRLKVRPHCLPDQRLILNLEINHDKVSGLSVQGTPAIETQGLVTEVAVPSGQTIVLGGLFTVIQTQQTEQLPWLGNLPGIGALFRWQTHHISRKELLIFISPSIVNKKVS